MLYGRLPLFLNTTRMVSPTTARISGPKNPRCCQAAGRGLSVLNVLSVYSRYSTFLYTVLTGLGFPLVKNAVSA